jgi:serine-type D-Ala-D-Ala carboxypeptidase/endopeptidase (penicillin-binding protein 4)
MLVVDNFANSPNRIDKISHEVNRNARACLIALMVFMPSWVFAQFSPGVRLSPLPAEIRKELAVAGLPESAWSAVVLPLPAKVLMGPDITGFGLNAESPMNPASVMKLVTTRAALGILGPGFRHRTRIATTGRLNGDTLKGDLFFQGGGDPKLVVEDLDEIVQRLRAMGVERIEGNLVIDGTRFAEPEIDPGLFDQRPTSTYNVGPHAAMVNFKSVKISVWPEANLRVRVMTEPRIPAPELKTRVQLVDGDCRRSQVSARMQDDNKILVSGVMGRACNGLDFYVSVMDHARFAFTAFKSAWESAGGEMKVSLQVGGTPPHARTLVDWESPRPLIELVADINKMSNNPMTRQLFLNLSARGDEPATREASNQVVRRYLASRGLVFPELVIDNGSGLSRDERISAVSLARLLTDALLEQNASEWISTLPMVGIEGTVKNRMRNSLLEGKAWLKTGTLNNVRALAGYVRSAEERWVVFVVMVNHPEAARARPAMDALIKWAYTYH